MKKTLLIALTLGVSVGATSVMASNVDKQTISTEDNTKQTANTRM